MKRELDRRMMLAMSAGALVSPGALRAASQRGFFERIGRPIGLQIYTLGDLPKTDLVGTLKQVAAIGYRDIELPGLLGYTPSAMRAAADLAGLSISSLHVGLSGDLSIRAEPQRIADLARTLGARRVVVPMFPFPAGFRLKPGDDVTQALANAVVAQGAAFWTDLGHLLNERAAALKPLGVGLGYHNHNIEFSSLGSTTGWDILMATLDRNLVQFEIDIGWVASAGLDPVAFLDRCRGRVRQLHVKDVGRSLVPNTALRTDPAVVGSGVLDWPGILRAAHAAGVTNFYVEQEPPFSLPRMEAAAQSYAFLARVRS